MKAKRRDRARRPATTWGVVAILKLSREEEICMVRMGLLRGWREVWKGREATVGFGMSRATEKQLQVSRMRTE